MECAGENEGDVRGRIVVGRDEIAVITGLDGVGARAVSSGDGWQGKESVSWCRVGKEKKRTDRRRGGQ